MNFIFVKFISEPVPNKALIFRKAEINIKAIDFISEN